MFEPIADDLVKERLLKCLTLSQERAALDPPKFWYENDEYLTLEWGIVRTNNVRYDDVDAVPSDGAESAPLYQVKRVLQGMAPEYTFSHGSCHIDNTREFRVMNATHKHRSCITMPEELEPDEARAAIWRNE